MAGNITFKILSKEIESQISPEKVKLATKISLVFF